MTLFRSKAEQKLIERGLDPSRLPPGQYLTEKWPVLHSGTVPRTDLATWDFRVFGEIAEPLTLTWEQFKELPSREITVDIHCVTRWSRFDTRFRGVHWSELAKLVHPMPTARFVVAHAEQGFTANVPLEAIEADDALIAYEADGEALTPDHGWPPSRTLGAMSPAGKSTSVLRPESERARRCRALSRVTPARGPMGEVGLPPCSLHHPAHVAHAAGHAATGSGLLGRLGDDRL